MANRTKAAEAARQEAIADMRKLCPPGSTVYTILDHVSSSGMSRAIRVVVPYVDREVRDGDHWRRLGEGEIAGDRETRETVGHWHPNYKVGIILGLRHWRRNGREQDALVVGGCGMDMGFHLVNSLSQAIWGGRYCHCWRDVDGATEAPYRRPADGCPDCAGTGTRTDSGYVCLGKGTCPSNYHVNYRSRERCEGIMIGDDRRRCYIPRRWRDEEIPADWPTQDHTVTVDGDDGQPISHTIKIPLACLFGADGEPTHEVCPTCQGAGDIPNPDGPERFDLVHTDGYALKQRWL